MKKLFHAFFTLTLLTAGILNFVGCSNDDGNNPIYYTIVFFSDGQFIEEQTVEKGKTAKKPSQPVKENYVFSAWYYSSDGIYLHPDGPFDFSRPIYNNIILVAVWTKNPSYTVQFYPNNDYNAGIFVTQSIFIGNTQKLQKNSFIHAIGYVFDSWNTKADGSGMRYNDEEEVFNLTDIQNDIVSLYAQWKPIQYSISFDANGGEGSMQNEILTYNEKKALSYNLFTKADFFFLNWNTKKDGSGQTYENRSTIRNLSTTNGETITLYAQWTAINSITIPMDEAKKLTLDEYKYYKITVTGEYSDLGMQYLTQKIKATSAKITLDMSAVTGNVIISNMSGNTNLVSVILPTVLETLSDNAFSNCTNLESVTIGNQVTTIGKYAFSSSKLQTISLPDSLKNIGERAFYNCKTLTTLTIPDSVIDIHYGRTYNINCGLFEGCSTLKEIKIGKNISDISYKDFLACTTLEAISIADNNAWYKSTGNIIYSKDDTKLIYCPAGKTGEVFIPATVTEISEYAFQDCTKITAITIGENVQTIRFYAFRGCTNITTIEIPASVVRIESDAFSSCTSLKTAFFAVASGWAGNNSLTLTDAEQNAKYLTNTYAFCTWTRTE